MIEDNRGDARLIELALARESQATFEVVCVPSLETGIRALRDDDFDAVLLDLSLPDAAGPELVAQVVARAGDVPVVVMTGYDDDEIGHRAIAAGAQDFLVKGRLDGRAIGQAVRHAIERHRITSQLAEQRQTLDAVLTSIGDALVVIGPNGVVQLANPAAARLLGPAALGDATETMDGWFLPDESTPCPGELTPFTRAARGESVDGDEVWVEHEAGGRWLSASVRPLRLNGRPAGGVVVLRDVTEEHASRAQVRALNVALHEEIAQRTRALVAAEAANRLKQQFLDVVSHELRTPLTPILGYAALLLRDSAALDELQLEGLRIIRESGLRLKSVVEAILDFQTLRSERTAPRPRPTDVRALLSAVLASAPDAETKVELAVDGQVPWSPTIDGALVTGVVAALVKNARNFGAGKPVRVHVGWADDQLTIAVVDQGVGIEPAHLEHIFDAFYQAEPALTRSRGGLGLGLAHARYLAESMKGRLWAESVQGAGSIFRLQIPAPVAQTEEGS